jgi:hypothetical protein
MKHKPTYLASDGFKRLPNLGGFCGGPPSAHSGGNGFNSGIRPPLSVLFILELDEKY